jgi:two-component system, chemotaxis family, sensor kinase CheA
MDTCLVVNRELTEDFVEESLDSLSGLPGQLDAYRLDSASDEPINAVFRAIHSIKGSAGFLELTGIQTFSHALENTLDEVRKGAISLGEDLQRVLVDGFDLLDAMLLEVAQGNIATEISSEAEALLQQIQSVAFVSPGRRPPDELLLEEILTLADAISDAKDSCPSDWAKQLRSLATGYAAGKTVESELPSSEAERPTPFEFLDIRYVCGDEDVSDRVLSVLGLFLAHQRGEYDEAVGGKFLESVGAFAAWARQAGHVDLSESLAAAAADFRTIFDSPLDLDENLLSLVWDHVWPALEKLEDPSGVEQNTPPKIEEAAGKTQQESGKPPTSQTAKARFLRVKEEHLKEFLERVSRLFITSELFKDIHSRMAETGHLADLVEELRQVNTDLKAESAALQQSVMTLRRVSVSGLFSKFPRMARTLASKLGKNITVHVAGEDTEIDKTLAEDLDAPLTHLIRNVVDHGIEPPDQRRARGVGETGNVWLEAKEDRNRVRIIVRDDGRGIDPDSLRRKAVEKGVIPQAEADSMSDNDALYLIFRPGFSTAEEVSDVSGRGVGMDVVRTTLGDHNGEVTIESKVGQGTTVCLDIPIRQATLVIDGLMVCQNDQLFVVPFEHIREITEIAPGALRSVHGRRMATIRGHVYDAVSLADILGLAPTEMTEKEPTTAVLVASKEGAACLSVDQVIGHRQVVVTAMKEILPDTEKVAGVAQLGGGQLALVLDLPEVLKDL